MTQLVSLGTRVKSFHRLAFVTIIDNGEALRLTWFQTFVLSSIDSCQNRVYANQYHMTSSAGSDVNFSRPLVFEVFSWPVISCKFITGSFQIYFLGEKAFFLSSKWLPLQCINVSFAFSSGYIYILNYYKKGIKSSLVFSGFVTFTILCYMFSNFRYSSCLGEARDFGVKMGVLMGLGIGFLQIIIYGSYALAFW